MAITDWDLFTSNSDVVTSLTFGTGVDVTFQTGSTVSRPGPLVGTGSLYFADPGLSNIKAHMQPKPSFGGSVDCGQIRSIIQTEVGGGVRDAGFYCMSSQTDLSAGTGSCYMVWFTTFLFQQRIHIGKSTTGVNSFSVSALASSPPAQWTDGTTFTLEFEWDATSGSNTLLTVRQGSSLDFSDLVTILSFNDTVGSLFVTNGEGIFINSVSGNSRVFFEQTAIQEISA